LFGFKPKLLVSDEEREWIDSAFEQLIALLGHKRITSCAVVLPTEQHFPDRYNASQESGKALFFRVCHYMGLDPALIDFQFFTNPNRKFHESSLFEHSYQWRDPAGLYSKVSNGSIEVVLDERLLKDPLVLVATIAHELAHVILLGDELIARDTPHMEPLTDLCTVALGFGVFNSSVSARFKQFQDDRKGGWSMQRVGYLSEPMYGYALAKFALLRNESRAAWQEHLNTNVRHYYKQSIRNLEKSR
jgi:hypothetical protein